MTRVRVALAAAVLVTASVGSALAAGADPPYSKRLQVLKALAGRYPGQVELKNALGRYGLWAGIVMQTTWQRDSHRDRIPLWALLNYHLSVEPTAFERLLARAGPNPTARGACTGTRPAEVCEGWVRYFIGVRTGLAPATLLKLLWRAHTTAIANVLRTERKAFDSVHTTALERNFWGSWIEIVLMLEAAHFPTNGTTSMRVSRLLMPPCSPLGAPGCRLTLGDLGRALPFASTLAHHKGSIERALREYTTLRKNPNAVNALALADPSFGAALALYLAIPR